MSTQDVVITLEGSEKKTSKGVILGLFLPVARFHACPAPQGCRRAPLMLTLGTSLVLAEQKDAISGCGHHIGRVRKEDLKTGRCGIFSRRCQISCMPRATAVATSTPNVDSFFFGCLRPQTVICGTVMLSTFSCGTVMLSTVSCKTASCKTVIP